MKNEDDKKWYYEKQGKQTGPVSADAIQVLVEANALSYGSIVWCKGDADWVKLEESELKDLLKDRPPPLVVKTDQKLKKTNVLLMIFLTIITAGIYQAIWFLRRRDAINSLQSKEKLNTGVFVFVIVLYSISLGLLLADVNAHLLDCIAGITLLVQCFKTRRILNEHFNTYLKRDMSFSGIATFFFTIFYLQYKINRF
jgi:GYF domain 2/Domain of unknown function (DUF4234)